MHTRPFSFVVAGAASAAVLTAASAPSPLYPIYQRLWGFSAFTLTVVFTVYVFALLVALLTVGSLSDRVGRRPVASAALVLLAVGMLLFATAAGTGDLIVARVVQGFAVGAATGTTTAMIVDAAPNSRSGSIVSSAVPSLGIAIGAILAGALVQFAPLPRQLVFWILGLAYLALAAEVWLVPDRARPAPPSQETIWRSLLPSAGLPPAVRPVFLSLLPPIAATWALAGLYLSLGSSILATILGVRSHFVVVLVLGLFFAAGVGGTVASPFLPSRLRERAGYGALAAGVLVTIAALLTGALPVYLIGSALAGLRLRRGVPLRHQRAGQGGARHSARAGLRHDVHRQLSRLQRARTRCRARHRNIRAQTDGGHVRGAGSRPGPARDGHEPFLQENTHSSERCTMTLVSQTHRTHRHTTYYLESGPADGPLMIFLHGWPEIGLIWRAQMEAFAADGWHCIAPDLRGYGRSSAPAATGAYATRELVTDMVELHDHLGGKPAIWAGHDWGSIVAGALAAHQPDRCRGVALVSWAYFPGSNSLATLVPLIDRTIYPAQEYPDGQWDYYRYYTTHFQAAVDDLDADPAATLASIYRPGDPSAVGQVAPSATVTRNGGRFGTAHHAPPTRPDPALWPQPDFDVLVQAFTRRGFGPSCAWYTNDEANIAYAREAPNGGRLSQPVLFVNGEWDIICNITGNRQGDPMREACPDLTLTSLPAGHWLPLERKTELTASIRAWLRMLGPGHRGPSTTS